MRWPFRKGRPFWAEQPQTFLSRRGQTELILARPQDHVVDQRRSTHVVTMRDVYDSVVVGLLYAAGVTHNQQKSAGFDPHDVDLSEVDISAVAQNACCEMERRLGIYPNVHTSEIPGNRATRAEGHQQYDINFYPPGMRDS